jgi:phage baseplate assembly protein W
MNKTFKDIDLRFITNPFTGDITALEGIAAIKNAVKNLVMLNKGERHFHPNIASNVVGLLFENIDEFVIDSVNQIVGSLVQKYEPRVNKVNVSSATDTGDSLRLNIQYSISSSVIQQSFDLIIQKNR